MDKGADYAKNEIQRLDRILAKVLSLYTSHAICHALITLFLLCFGALLEHYISSPNPGISDLSFLVSSLFYMYYNSEILILTKKKLKIQVK